MVPVSHVNLRRAAETTVLDGKQTPKGAAVFCTIYHPAHIWSPLLVSHPRGGLTRKQNQRMILCPLALVPGDV